MSFYDWRPDFISEIPQTYIITNLLDGKVYIGKTKDFKRRLKQHKRAVFDPKSREYNTYIHRAMRKHDVANFVVEPFAYYDTYDEAGEAETFWIAEMRKLLGRNNVYNESDGGNGCSGYKHTEDAKKRIGEAHSGEKNHMFGKKHTEETLRLMSIASSGERNYMYGRRHTDEVKRICSEINKGRPCSEEKKQYMSELMSGSGNSMFGKTQTDEAKLLISEANERAAEQKRNELGITKETLSKLVWEKSFTDLGKELGVCSTTIAYWAHTYEIATPPLGYWGANHRKVERPSKDELAKMLWEKPSSQIAKDYGVVARTIKAWADHYGLSKPPPGYWMGAKSRRI